MGSGAGGPWMEWLDAFVGDLLYEADLLVRRPQAAHVHESAVRRYRALLKRVHMLGPLGTPLALQRLGIAFTGSAVPVSVREAVQRLGVDRDAEKWLYAVCVSSSGERFERCWQHDYSSDIQDELPIASEPPHHAELLLFHQLAVALGDGSWKGEVHLHAALPPSLSSLGAMAQFCRRWAGFTVSVSFDSESAPLQPKQARIPSAQPHASEELELAVRRFLASGRAGPRGCSVTLLGSDRAVRSLWKEVSAAPRSSSKGAKKREWQDKLKFFLQHKPAFHVDIAEPCLVKFQEEGVSSGRGPVIDALVVVLQSSIARFLQAGREVYDDVGRGGFVLVGDLADDAEVMQAWHRCSFDQLDRLAYFLNHHGSFEVWRAKDARDPQLVDADPRVVRSRVRLRL